MRIALEVTCSCPAWWCLACASSQGYYFTGDGCHRDKDGFYWITGRVDDVLNVSGHRIGTAEVRPFR